MKCKICNRISNSIFCSQECKDESFVLKKKTKIKKAKIRFCLCGEILKKSKRTCDKCEFNKKDKILEKRFEYGIFGKCLNCGDNVIGFINRKNNKKFCTAECQKKYSYELAKKNHTL